MSSKNNETRSRTIIIIVASVILVLSLAYLAYYLIQEKRAEELNNDLANRHTDTVMITQETEETTAPTETTAPETTTTEETTVLEPLVELDSMKSFIEENPDTAGWITVGGTSIDNVVVQCADNDFYLDHDFYGRSSQPGTVFADYRCVVNDYGFNQSDNIILYGHNQANGTMFGTLQKYKITKQNTSKFDFYLQHPTFTFSNLYEEYTYKIIALFVCEVEPQHTRDGVVFDYQNYIRFGSKEYTYEQFMKNVTERSEIITGVDVCEDDQFLTLSTCSNEFEPSRFIVIGRKVRDGESPEVDTSLAKLNPDVKEPDWNFIYGN
ncbi:MAG: class B sortase [Oscillospiraceae bacterium]|nr:class B sortase [Oscillospiraceae bacterium]